MSSAEILFTWKLDDNMVPTEKQKEELCEGKTYSVEGVAPTSSDSGTLYLQKRWSSSTWTPLSPVKVENFEEAAAQVVFEK